MGIESYKEFDKLSFFYYSKNYFFLISTSKTATTSGIMVLAISRFQNMFHGRSLPHTIVVTLTLNPFGTRTDFSIINSI